MSTENCPVLAATIAYYDETQECVTPAVLVEESSLDRETVTDRINRLVECELLTPTQEGYRPTVTGREFLALDVDCGPIIVDTEGCE